MASIHSFKCLLRPSIAPSFRTSPANSLPRALAFSTTASLNAKAPKPKAGTHVKKLRLKKKDHVRPGRLPAPGERKAMRKRIVLSNTNAIEVQDMVDLTPEALLQIENVGTVMGIPGSVVDQLRAAEAFKTTQGWGLFRRPGLLIRKESVEISRMLEAAESQKRTTITIVDGERGTGKSMLLLHAMATAFTKGWIVVNIPEAQELTTAATAYAPIPYTKPQAYTQNNYTANLLSQIYKSNSAVLSTLKLTKSHNLPIPLQSDVSLARLAELGSRDPSIAWPVFLAFWSEITSDGRPPILFTLDGLAHIMRVSAYRAPDFSLIHSHDFTLVSHFTSYLSGSQPLPNGGSIIAATSKGNSPICYATSLAIKQQTERQNGVEISKVDPFQDLDERAYETMKAAGIVKLGGLSKEEARGLMEYWAKSGLLRETVDERIVVEKWTVAGHGVVGEIERAALRMRI